MLSIIILILIIIFRVVVDADFLCLAQQFLLNQIKEPNFKETKIL